MPGGGGGCVHSCTTVKVASFGISRRRTLRFFFLMLHASCFMTDCSLYPGPLLLFSFLALGKFLSHRSYGLFFRPRLLFPALRELGQSKGIESTPVVMRSVENCTFRGSLSAIAYRMGSLDI